MGLIDHLTMAIYMVNEDRDAANVKSTIKFGSMDKIGLKDSTRAGLFQFKTRHKGTWDLRSGSLKLGGSY